MSRVKNRNDFFELVMFDQKVEGARGAGARLSPVQAAFLRSAVYEGYRKAMGQHPKPMAPRERNVKKTFFDSLTASVADVEAYLVFVRTIYQSPAWLKPRDLRRAVSKQQLARIVTDLCSVFGREYADPVLSALRGVYEAEGERIQIVRDAT